MNDKIIEISEGVYGIEVYRGIIAPGIDFYGEAKTALNVDIENNPDYLISSDGAMDDNGISETISSENVVYRVYDTNKTKDPILDPILDPISDSEEKEDDEVKQKIQDMLDKYYGNKAKLKEYKKRYKRFISHIVERDGYKTVEDYKEKTEDAKFLQLEEYAYRLERFSKAEKGDTEAYEQAIKLYELTGTIPKDEEGNDLTVEEIIQALRAEDQEYIETNNYAYNQHKVSHENLKTLGKHGEKVAYYKLREIIEKNEKTGDKTFNIKALGEDVLSSLMNAGLFIRNYTKRPLYCFVGKIISSVHGIMLNSKKNAEGVYKNLRTHRYNARKDVFEQLFELKFLYKNIEREKAGKKPIKKGVFSYALKKAFKPRFEAIFKARQGNVIVETAKANEIEKSAKAIAVIKAQQKQLDQQLKSSKENMKKQLLDLEERLEKETDESIIKGLLFIKDRLEKQLKQIEEDIRINENRPMPSVIQTDPISMAQHEKANRENITKVVTAVATVARVAAIKYLGPKITKWIKDKLVSREYVEGQIIEKKVWVEGKVDKEQLKDITIGDLYDSSQKQVTYHATGGATTVTPADPHFRGIYFEQNGFKYSGTDGIGYNWKMGPTGVPYSTSQISPISGNSKFFETMAETISKTTGKTVTSDELISQVLTSSDPVQATKELAGNIKLWVSSSDYGVAKGWSDALDGIVSIMQKASEGHYITDKIKIPGYYVDVVNLVTKKVIDPRILSVIIALGADEVLDLYDLLRRTKSKEEMKKEGTHLGEVQPHQKETNKPYTERNISNKWNFTGNKREDYDSLYDESEFGADTPTIKR